MSTLHTEEITRLLHEVSNDNRDAIDQLLPLIYDELHVLAHRQHFRFHKLQTLNTTALVHEAYLKLVDQRESDWKNRSHFFCVAARAMRHILIDYLRGKNSQKRGGGAAHLSIDDVVLVSEDETEELQALETALKKLEKTNPRQGQIVECRFFAGMTIEETAAVLDISPATVKRDWRVAQAWLFREMKRDLTQ